MLLVEYMTKALITWWVGFFPYFEVYAAVAAGMAMKLDVVSSVAWAVFGNFTPIPLLMWGYSRLMRIPQFRHWLLRLEKRGVHKVKRAFDRYGAWFLIVMTPILGSWTIAVVAPLTGMKPKRLLLFSFIGITIYAIVTAAIIASGVNWFTHR
ncbi:small multi-drug export protein [Trichocoleus sp. FACHB-90]|uniref:small multi-drug export protein n=1 Tax=Cyanophyceae TaxID=3028117 RepID=UPI001685C14E|nr:small multi-drug export protein [Trichocoleus sp. FACHB-90]MBD1925721.1 small multi-drug export protein [Trichocoleus sp. FACHB-90]